MDVQLIQSADGTVTLPSGQAIGASLMHRTFKETGLYEISRTLTGDAGYTHYLFSAGTMDSKPWTAVVRFFNELLVNVDLSVNLYDPDKWVGKQFDLDVEAETKRYQERLLIACLGSPEVSSIPQAHAKELSDQQRLLAVPVTWKYRWGHVLSSHDFNRNSTWIRVTYSSRTEKKFARFKVKPPKNQR